jgi:hypothetical protein
MDSGTGHTLLAAFVYHMEVVEIKTQYRAVPSLVLCLTIGLRTPDVLVQL